MEFYSVSSPVGAGKTYAAIKHAATIQQLGGKVLIVQPTRLLIDKTIEDLTKMTKDFPSPCKVNFIYSEDFDPTAVFRPEETRPPSAVKEITAHFRDADPTEGEILFITLSAFLQVKFFHRPDLWHLIVDEIPDVLFYQQMNFAEHREWITSYFTALPSEHRGYSALTSTGKPEEKRMVKNEQGDSIWGLVKDFMACLTSKHWKCFIDTDNLESFRRGGDKDSKALFAFGLLQPSAFFGFKTVTIMGADFEESLMYWYWGDMDDVKFTRHKKIKSRFDAHSNGHQLTIYYAHKFAWSKAKQNEVVNGRKLLELDVERTNKLFGKEPSVFMANVGTPGIASLIDESVQMPNKPHGLNHYSAIDNVAVFSALNLRPNLNSFVKLTMGMSGDEITDAIARQQTYQATGRSSLREPKSTTQKRVVVMDEVTALWLQKRYPGSKIVALPGDPLPDSEGDFVSPDGFRSRKAGRPKLHENNASMCHAHRNNERDQRVNEFKRANSELSFSRLENTLGTGGKSVVRFTPHEPGYLLHIYQDKYQAQPITSVDLSETATPGCVTDIVELLRSRYEDSMRPGLAPRKKNDLPLFCAAAFRAGATGPANRKLDNIEYIQNIYLDCDGGKWGNGISKEEFAAACGDFRLAICNSSSNGKAGSSRWRAIIPTDAKMTPAIHKHIIDKIMKRLYDKGYRNTKQMTEIEANPAKHIGKTYKHDGFDTPKFTANALFHVPSQAQRCPEHSFFIEYNTDKPNLDVLRMISQKSKDRPAPPQQPAPEVVPPDTAILDAPQSPAMLKARAALLAIEEAAQHTKTLQIKQTKIDTAVSRLLDLAPGDGHRGFFAFGAALQHAGCDRHEIEQHLNRYSGCVGGGRSKAQRAREIPEIIRCLK